MLRAYDDDYGLPPDPDEVRRLAGLLAFAVKATPSGVTESEFARRTGSVDRETRAAAIRSAVDCGSVLEVRRMAVGMDGEWAYVAWNGGAKVTRGA
jgi:hypothetical protein